MYEELAQQLLKEQGLDSSPTATKELALLLQRHINPGVMEALPPYLDKAFGTVAVQGPEKTIEFLKNNVPNYQGIVNERIASFKKEHFKPRSQEAKTQREDAIDIESGFEPFVSELLKEFDPNLKPEVAAHMQKDLLALLEKRLFANMIKAVPEHLHDRLSEIDDPAEAQMFFERQVNVEEVTRQTLISFRKDYLGEEDKTRVSRQPESPKGMKRFDGYFNSLLDEMKYHDEAKRREVKGKMRVDLFNIISTDAWPLLLEEEKEQIRKLNREDADIDQTFDVLYTLSPEDKREDIINEAQAKLRKKLFSRVIMLND